MLTRSGFANKEGEKEIIREEEESVGGPSRLDGDESSRSTNMNNSVIF